MTRLGLRYPGYGFEHHKGYSVPEHFEALARLGPTIHHRRSFAPVAAAYGDVLTADMKTGEIEEGALPLDRKSTRLNSSHQIISYAVFCLKKKKKRYRRNPRCP